FKVAVYRAATWRLVNAPQGVDTQTVFGTTDALVLGTITEESSGDAGVQGVPGLARAGADDLLGAPFPARVTKPTRGLAPDVTTDGSGRSVLVFQEKDRPRAFSREAPVYASVAQPGATALGTRQLLDTRQAYQPTVRPFGPGAIAVWQNPHDRWGVAIER